MNIRISALALLMLIPTACVMAENIGSKAATFQIDKDGREQLKDVVKGKKASGEIDQFWKDFQQRNIAAIKNPAPLGIQTNYKTRTELRELKFVIPADYRDDRGQIIVKRGTVVEPLKVQPLTQGLIFIDGRDQRQVDYAIAKGKVEPLKIVLTAGSPFDLRVKYKNADWRGGKTIPFYFDQRRMIISSLNRLYGIDISSVPATMTQRGDKLQVEFGIR